MLLTFDKGDFPHYTYEHIKLNFFIMQPYSAPMRSSLLPDDNKVFGQPCKQNPICHLEKNVFSRIRT